MAASRRPDARAPGGSVTRGAASAPALVERERELALVLEAWRAATAGHGSTWLIVAEAGGGKTRLVNEVIARTHARVCWGAAEPVTPPEPWLAVRRAILGFQPGAVRAGSLAAALAALDAQTSAGALLIALDDLHFADEATMAFATRLAKECRTRPWLVLATARSGEPWRALLAPLLDQCERGGVRRLDLAPLSREGVAQLAARAGGSWTGDALDRLARDSGGNPWFVEAIARGGSAATLHDQIMLRIDTLDAHAPGARRVLEALAPAAAALPHALLVHLCADVSDRRRVLRTLRDGALLVERDGGWAFRHDLTRRAVLDAMLDADRREAHRNLGRVLAEAQREPPDSAAPARIAMHFAEARDPRAAFWAERAAEQARAVDAHTE